MQAASAVPFQPDAGNGDPTRWSLPAYDNIKARLGQGRVSATALSPDGRWVLVASDAGLWWHDAADMSLHAFWAKDDTGYTSDAAFSPDGQKIVTGGRKTARVWDIQTGRIETTLEHKSDGSVGAVAYSPDGRLIAGIVDRKSLVVWDAETGELRRQMEERVGRWGGPLLFSPNGRLIACLAGISCGRGAESIAVLDVNTGETAAHFTSMDGALSLSFSPCGKLLASGEQGAVHVWDIHSGNHIERFSAGGKSCMLVSYTPSGELRAAEESSGGQQRVWDVKRNELIFEDEPRAGIFGDAFVDGTTLLYFSDLEWRIWKEGEGAPRVGPHTFIVISFDLRFLQDGKTLACLSAANSGIVLWDTEAPQAKPRVFNPIGEGCHSMDISADGKLFAASALKKENAVYLRRIDGGGQAVRYKGETAAEIWSSKLAIKGGVAAHVDEEDTIYLWDARSGEPIRTIDAADSIFSFCPNGKYLSVRIEREEWDLLDIQTGEKVLDSEENPLDAYSFCFSPDSRLIASYSKDEKRIALWDIERGAVRLTIPWPDEWDESQAGCESYTFTPDGRYLAGCYSSGMKKDEKTTHIWRVETGEKIAALQIPHAQSLAFSPDGSLLAACGYDGPILLWELRPPLL